MVLFVRFVFFLWRTNRWDVIFFYGHGQLSNEWYENLLSVCSVAELKNNTQTPQCASLVAEMYQVVGGFFEYNLYGESSCVELKKSVPKKRQKKIIARTTCSRRSERIRRTTFPELDTRALEPP